MNVWEWFGLYLLLNIVFVFGLDFYYSTKTSRFGIERDLTALEFYLLRLSESRKTVSPVHIAVMLLAGLPIWLIVQIAEFVQERL